MFKVVAVLLAGYVAASLVSGYTVTHDVVDNMQRTNEVDPSYEDDYYEETSGPDLFMEEDYLIDDIPMYMEGSPVTIGEDDLLYTDEPLYPDLDIENADDISGYPPPPPADIDIGANCPCKKILVSSLNEAEQLQHGSMGIFKYYSDYNGRPAYHGPNSQRLYFLKGSGWLIGSALGSPTGFVHNANQYACPYLVPGDWMYVNNGYWYKDQSLVVRCIPS